jgi:hypothetical protein
VKFQVREGFALFRGRNAAYAALAHASGAGKIHGRQEAGSVVELTGEEVSGLSDRELGMLEPLDDDARSMLRGVKPTIASRAPVGPQDAVSSSGLYEMFARGQEKPRERPIPSNSEGLVIRTREELGR